MRKEDGTTHAGQAVYSRAVLAAYDALVLGLSNRWVWRCPTRRLEAWYREHATGNHLDVGVGTGYFLDRWATAKTGSERCRVVLADMNPNCLEAAARRIERLGPKCYRRDVLEPLRLEGEARFDSVGMNYLLHCLPGEMSAKAAAFDHAIEQLNAGGVLFGATLLAEGVERNRVARGLMRFYQGKGIFGNERDSREGLERELERRFRRWQVEIVGCAALFCGWRSE